MKALSLIQPWASLIVLGEKRIETRSWPTRHRGHLAIHANKNLPDDRRRLCNGHRRFVKAQPWPHRQYGLPFRPTVSERHG
jgi:hypothetical protein